MKVKERLLTPREAGEWLGVTPRTVVRWIREGKMKGVKVGRVWRVSSHEVNRAMHIGLRR